MKLIPLFIANIKSFTRNWKSVLLLLGTPLIIITIIFLSLSQAKVARVDIGLVSNVNLPQEYLDQFNSTFEVHLFSTQPQCIESIHKYNNYACLEIKFDQGIQTNIYYDNTREPISWEILQMLKIGIDALKTRQSIKTISGFLSQAQGATQCLSNVARDLTSTRKNIETYEDDLNSATINLKNAGSNLDATLTQMESDLADAKQKRNAAQQNSDLYFDTTSNSIIYAKNSLSAIPNDPNTTYLKQNAISSINDAQNSLRNTRNQVNSQLNDVDNKIDFYEQQREVGVSQKKTIDSYVDELQQKKSDLATYRNKIIDYEKQLSLVMEQLQTTNDLDARAIVNPIKLTDIPTYLPVVSSDSTVVKKFEAQNISEEAKLVQAASFLNLQILYPKLFFLIVFFLSLLVSTFICLRDIHSPSTIRVKLVRHVFFPQVLSTYLSSTCISFIPILVVLLAGKYLFLLPIFDHIWLVILITLLTSSAFILLGMFISYLIKNESITLLLSTFTLILVIFFSGFLYPIERMQHSFADAAQMLPLRIAVQDFYQIVYYGNTDLGFDLVHLFIWVFVLLALLCMVKYIRNL